MQHEQLSDEKSIEIKPFQLRHYIAKNGTFFTILIAMLGIFGPLGYLIGILYYDGYLSAFGVNSSAFPANTSDIYLYSYVASVLVIADISSFILSTQFLYYLIPFLFYLVISASTGAASARWYIKTESNPTGFRKVVNKLYDFYHPKNSNLTIGIFAAYLATSWLLTAFFVTLCVFLIWMSLFNPSYTKASEMAQASITKYLEEGCTYSDTTKISTCAELADKSGKTIAKGLQVASDKKRIAIFDGNSTTIYTISDTDKVIRRYSSPQQIN